MLKEYSLLALQKAINCALTLDEDMPAKIKPLEGKVLEVVINPLNVCFFLNFHQGCVRLLAYYEGIPDTVIHSNPLGLIRLSLLPASKLRSVFNDNIRISGDVELGQEVKALFDNIEVDWEGHLAHFTGDVVAHQIGSWVRGFQSTPYVIPKALYDGIFARRASVDSESTRSARFFSGCG